MFGFNRRHGRHEMEERGRHGHREGCSSREHGEDGERSRMHRGEGGPRGFMGERGRRGGGPMGRGRFFDHGDLKLVILALVAEGPRHGYDIIKEIEERSSGAYSPSPGVVYPTLSMLEDQGYVTVEAAAGNRKLSQITDAGREFLKSHEDDVKVFFARMEAVKEGNNGGRNPQLVRAMENLKLALRLKFTSGSITPEQASVIAAALDEAVAKIERA